MKVFIKNMVCQGSKKFVLEELNKLDFRYNSFELGEIDFQDELSQEDIQKLDYSLHKYGLGIIYNRTSLVLSIRTAVQNLVRDNTTLNTSFSYYISSRIGYDYRYLNKCFTDETGMPIEEYYLEKKNEKLTEKIKLEDYSWAKVLNLKN